MALRASFVQPRDTCLRPDAERSVMRRFEDVRAVRVVALHAIHPVFEHGMVLRQFELRMHIDVAGKARLRLPARIHDEPAASAAGIYVQTARPVT